MSGKSFFIKDLDAEIEKAKKDLNDLYLEIMIDYIIDNDLIKSSAADIAKRYLEIKITKRRVNRKIVADKAAQLSLMEQNKKISGVLPYIHEALKTINDEISRLNDQK